MLFVIYYKSVLLSGTSRRAYSQKVLAMSSPFAIIPAHVFMSNTQEEENTIGTVIEALPNTMFRLKLDGDVEHIAYLGGKMKLHRIRVLIGDKVEVKMDPYGGKGRIVKRM